LLPPHPNHHLDEAPMNIEPLEARIAPASFVTFPDIDGDQVKVTTSAGDLTGAVIIFSIGGKPAVAEVRLNNPGLDGANLTVTVTKVLGGDGLTTVGHIDGGTNDFGSITIAGDLGDIDCGSGTAGTPAIKSLNVRSLGAYGLASQPVGGDLTSNLFGALGALH